MPVCQVPMQPFPIAFQPSNVSGMEPSTYIPDAALPQYQQDSSDLPSSPSCPGPPKVIPVVHPQTGKPCYLCSKCRSVYYTQSQVAWRHIRTAHKPKKCSLCNFSYARPYEYGDHLKKKHRVLNPALILGKASDSRGRATIVTEFKLVPQQAPISPPTAVEDQQIRAGSQLCPPAPSFLAVATSVSQPAVSFGPGDYNSLQNSQFGSPSAYPVESTVTHSPFNPETTTAHAHFPPGGDNYVTSSEDGSFDLTSPDTDFFEDFLRQIARG